MSHVRDSIIELEQYYSHVPSVMGAFSYAMNILTRYIAKQLIFFILYGKSDNVVDSLGYEISKIKRYHSKLNRHLSEWGALKLRRQYESDTKLFSSRTYMIPDKLPIDLTDSKKLKQCYDLAIKHQIINTATTLEKFRHMFPRQDYEYTNIEKYDVNLYTEDTSVLATVNHNLPSFERLLDSRPVAAPLKDSTRSHSSTTSQLSTKSHSSTARHLPTVSHSSKTRQPRQLPDTTSVKTKYLKGLQIPKNNNLINL